MTTDKIEIKEDAITDAPAEDRASGVDNETGGNRQPPQAQQRTETQTATPTAATDDEGGLPVGNKGKSPGNGG